MNLNPDIWDGRNPWLGLGTYSEGLRLYGRDVEVETLTNVICNNVSTVVFGKSGVGKSSLLHAGIFPKIRQSGMMPIYVRFEHNSDVSYVEQIENAVSQKLDKKDMLGNAYPHMGLWDFFHRHVFYDKEKNVRTPVIVIDQFEEIYTLADENHKYLAQDLFEEFADLLNNIKPDRVVAYEKDLVRFSKSKIETGTSDELTFRVHVGKTSRYVDGNEFHIVLCLREDYLYYLERNTSKIPSFKINRYSLQALDRSSALDVVMKPCPGLFSEEEADVVLKKIATSNDDGKVEVDPTILSIFLFRYFNSRGDVYSDNIIEDFYVEETKDIDFGSLNYLEDHLITGEGYRQSIPYNDALLHGVKQLELERLIRSRILTVEPRRGHECIEFSHDTICSIAKVHREKRLLDEQTRRLKKRILFVTGLSLLAIMIISCFVYLTCLVIEDKRSLKVLGIKNVTSQSHYNVLQGNVTNAVRLLLENVLDVEDANIMPETEWVLNQAYDSLNSNFACIAILKHFDDVVAGQFSLDSVSIMTASNDGICRFWDRRFGELSIELNSGNKSITSASLNRDGSRVLVAYSDSSLVIWDVPTQKILRIMKGHSAIINHVELSPDGLYAISASQDKTIKLWDVETGECVNKLIEHQASINTAVFSKDGTKIISASEDGTSIIYDRTTRTQRKIYIDNEFSVEYAAFNNNNDKVVIASADVVYVLNCKTGNIEKILAGHEDLVTSAVFSPDGSMIATTSHDKTIKLWDVSTGEEVHTYNGHTNVVQSAAFSLDGRHLLSVSRDNEARIWNVCAKQTNNVIYGGMGVLVSGTYSPDGKYIAAISVDGNAKIWNANTLEDISRFSVGDMANSISFSEASDKVVVASDCNVVRMFDVETGNLLDSIDFCENISFDYALFADNDSSIIAISHNHRTVKWKLSDKTIHYIIEPSLDSLRCIRKVLGDSIYLVSAARNNSFLFWNAKEKHCLKIFNGHLKDVWSVNLNHDETSVISASADNTAIIWDVETGNIVHKLKRHSSQVYFAEFNNDGNYVITTSTDGTVKLWNAVTGTEVATKMSHSGAKYTLMFNPQKNEYMVIDDGTVQIYDLLNANDLVLRFRTIRRTF